MSELKKYDCIVIGSGPNGLAAAIALQSCGFQTHIIEKHQTPGGGLRSEHFENPGFILDNCSAIHPMATISPFFRALELKNSMLDWIYPEIPCAHPLEDKSSVALYCSLEQTVDQFSSQGAKRYKQLFENLIRNIDLLADEVLQPLLHLPTHPYVLAQFGARAIWPAVAIAQYLADEKSAALFGGMAAHSFLPFDKFLSGAAGLMLMLAGHAHGWPLARGGSGQISQFLIQKFQSLGGTIETGLEVLDISTLPKDCTLFFDTAPRELARLAGDFLPEYYLKKLKRYRYGPAAYKIDYILSEPIPWLAKECRQAGTVHLGGSFEEIKNAENTTWHGHNAKPPFMLLAQPSLFDRTRCPPQREVVWSYAHVPHESSDNITDLMDNHIESYAPGFKNCILAKKISTPKELEEKNPNLVGGDIVGGVADLWQTIARPLLSLNPYSTPNKRIYLCSASTPPGAGIHGMCGIWAAQAFIHTQKKGLSVLTKIREKTNSKSIF